MNKRMKISIITTCFNRKATIRNAVESVLAQDYPGIEYIVVDGASSDGTLEWLQLEPLVKRFISEPDTGVYNAMNKSLDLCNGEFVIFMKKEYQL